MHPFQQPSDVNFTGSIPKGEYQKVARSWRHGGQQTGIAFYELGGQKKGFGNRMLKLRIYDMFTFKSIKHLFHRLTPEQVDAGRFWKTTP
jgi:hypothetical protein